MDPKKLYVGNLDYSVTGDQLRDLFSQAGVITDAVVISDKFSGRSKGFGFVEFATAEAANAAVEQFNGFDHMGRKLVVNVARPKAPRNDFHGRGQGGFRGNDGDYQQGGFQNRQGGGYPQQGGGQVPVSQDNYQSVNQPVAPASVASSVSDIVSNDTSGEATPIEEPESETAENSQSEPGSVDEPVSQINEDEKKETTG